MSGELKPTGSFTVGQPILALARYTRNSDPVKGVVTKVGRVWAEAQIEGWRYTLRFRLDNGTGDERAQHNAILPEVRAYDERVQAAWAVLKAHGLGPSGYEYGRVHDAELFAVAELLERGVTTE